MRSSSPRFPNDTRQWTPPASFTGAAAGGTLNRPEPTLTSVAVGRLGVVVKFLRDRRQLDLAIAVENIVDTFHAEQRP